jgi:hypothetical protein
MAKNDDLGRMWKEAVVTGNVKVFAWRSRGEPRDNSVGIGGIWKEWN